jgi:hypothetical protein
MKTKNKIALAAIFFVSAALFFSAGLNRGVAQTYSGAHGNPGPGFTARSASAVGCWCATGASQYPGYNPHAKVTYTSQGECAKKGGHCFSSRDEAYAYVHTPQRRRSSTCWCYIPMECIRAPCPGRVINTTVTDCQNHGGHCFSSREEALAYRNRSSAAPVQICWCCSGSGRATTRVIHTTMAECQEKGGTCYQSQKDAERDCFMRGEFH